MEMTKQQLRDLNFLETSEHKPRLGALLICYHDIFGLTIGYFTGKEAAFIFPHVEGYNWATHWKYHGN